MLLKLSALAAFALALASSAYAQTARPPSASTAPQATSQPPATARISGGTQQRFVPGMARYTDDVLFGDVWVRPQLSPRDRSLVVISVLIATNKPDQLSGHLGRALSNGVTPVEASGALTHLAIYSGWPNAVSALNVYQQVYTSRNVDLATLQSPLQALPVTPPDTALTRPLVDPFAIVAPKFSQLTNDVVFGDLWRRSDLSVRDRSLVTIAALAAMGDDEFLEPYLRRGVEAGLTRDQIAEALTHIGFYAGWPKATKALTTVARVLG